MGNLRTVIRSKEFDQELSAIEPDVKRADEFIEGAETILSREPEIGHKIGNSRVYFIAGWTVDLNLYYTFNEDEVILLSICKMAPPAP